MAQLPTNIDIALDTTFNYIDSVNELPESGVSGQVVVNTGNNLIYAYHPNGVWMELSSLTSTKSIKEELLEVLDRYPESVIAKDIRSLLKVYERNSYT